MEKEGLKGTYTDSGKYSNGTAVEGVHFVIETDGNNGKIRVINFNNEELCPRNGIIELRAIYGGKEHENRHSPWSQVTKVWDKKLSCFRGIPTRVNNRTKELEFQRITLRDREVYDLSNFTDAMKWCIIKESKYVEGSSNLGGKKPLYRVYDKEREAEIFLNKRNVKRKAEGIAEGLIGEQLVEMARNCGLDISLMSPTVMSMAVIKYAEQYPKQFMEIWDSPNRAEITVLKKAMATGVVVHDQVNGYMFGGLPFGMNEAQAVEYLKQNIQTRQVIDMQSKKNEDETVKSMSNIVAKPISDERDSELAQLKAKLADMEARMLQVSKAKIDEVTEEILTEPIVTDDTEHAELLLEAKRLKIMGAHKIKSKEDLRRKIEERKASIKN